MSKEKVYIEIKGGNVQRVVVSSQNVEVIIVDRDNIDAADNAEEEVYNQCLPYIPDQIGENIAQILGNRENSFPHTEIVKHLARRYF